MLQNKLAAEARTAIETVRARTTAVHMKGAKMTKATWAHVMSSLLLMERSLRSATNICLISVTQEDKELYMLQPANKSDRMCHLVAMTMRSSCSSSHIPQSKQHSHMQ